MTALMENCDHSDGRSLDFQHLNLQSYRSQIMRQIILVVAVAVTSILLGAWTTAETNRGNVRPDGSASETIVRSTMDRTYSLTIALPARTGASFNKLSFTERQPDQGTEPIRFDLPATEVFIGTPSDRPIESEAWVDETGTFWIEFNPPVAAGTTLTVVLKLQNLPSEESYEYGFAAYPATENSVAVYVGDRTLTIRR
jgi:hypothetical protein